MNRRSLLKRFGAVVTAAVVAPAVGGEVAEAAPVYSPVYDHEIIFDKTMALDVGVHPEPQKFWCTIHQDQNGAGHWHSVIDAMDEARGEGYREGRAEGYERREFIEAKRTENRAQEISFYGTDPVPVIGYMVALENQTFEALQAACSDRGCLLENQYSIERLRHEFFHMKRGQEWPDETLTMRHADPQKVYAWLKGLHA